MSKVSKILTTVGVLGFVALLGILGVCIAILIKVNKNNGSDSNGGNSTPSPNSNFECMNKSTLPQAADNSSFDPFKWGSLRGQLYFGMQTRHPLSPRFGVLWQKKDGPVRYWCDSSVKVTFMWTDADFQSFGEQPIVDGDLKFSTLWINQNRSFSAKIVVDPNTTLANQYSFLFYLAFQDTNSFFQSAAFDPVSGFVSSSTGTFSPLGNFTVSISTNSAKSISQAFLADTPFVEMATVQSFLQKFQQCNITGYCSFNNTSLLPYANLFVVQADFTDPQFTFQFDYKINSDPNLPDFDTTHSDRKKQFRDNFAKVFPISDNDVAANFTDMGRAALSNMLGSISYWHGYSNATGSCLPNGTTVEFGPLDLIAAEPSRADFPRGFLWDDGFHNLLIRQFDTDLAIQIISSWLDTMNTYGWIPREMFLTKEAAAKVPPGPWLIEQDNVANPPMLIYLVGKLMADSDVMSKYGDRVVRLYPRLKLFYNWMKTIQKGPVDGSFQWQGRDATTELVLNPPTLPSGLDDYPRATHPSKDEYHLDIKCWMAMSSSVLLDLAKLTNDSDWLPTISADQKLFNDLDLLNKLHWSNATQGYYDYGNHSFNVILICETRDGVTTEYRHTLVAPEKRLVTDVFGYVNIFPFLLKLLPANSAQLGVILKNITDPNCLWTDFGLRSVAKLINGKPARYYDAFNNIASPPYWRSPIWINLNYFALDALKHYSTVDGPYKQEAGEYYRKLRSNIISNMGKVYRETGFIWEHYDDKTGAGAGTRPFTGWSALVLAIMGDDYR